MIDAAWIDREGARAVDPHCGIVVVAPPVYAELLALAKAGLPPETGYAGVGLAGVIGGVLGRTSRTAAGRDALPGAIARALQANLTREISRWFRAVYGPQLGNAAQKAISEELRRILA